MSLQSQSTVAEIQGYYGSLNIAERVLQAIWKNRDFNHKHLFTFRGEALEILDPGDWNHQEGPDFRGARLKIGNKAITGDVEVHLYAKDWVQHRHTEDQNFDHVVLHVTLFDSPRIRSEPPHRLVLLPYLKEDIESLLTRYMLKNTFDPDGLNERWIVEFLGMNDPHEQHRLLLEKSRHRWEQKLRYARERLKTGGWKQTCHQSMMEVLGYRRNRVPMHELSLEYPLEPKSSGWDPETVFKEKKGRWKLSGSRPGNHPLKRLRSYRRMLDHDPNWPEALLLSALSFLGSVEFDGLEIELSQMKKLRVMLRLGDFLETLQQKIFVNEIGGTRIHTMVCDAFLPLLSVNAALDLFPFWFLWQAGDYPDQLKHIILESRLRGIRGSVQCNGWLQGLLQFGFESMP